MPITKENASAMGLKSGKARTDAKTNIQLHCRLMADIKQQNGFIDEILPETVKGQSSVQKIQYNHLIKGYYRKYNSSQFNCYALCEFISTCDIYYDQNPMKCVVEEDQEFVAYYFDFPEPDMEDTDHFLQILSAWMLRVEFNTHKMKSVGICIVDIAHEINATFSDIKCFHSNIHSDKSILQIRLINEERFAESENYERLHKLKLLLFDEIEIEYIVYAEELAESTLKSNIVSLIHDYCKFKISLDTAKHIDFMSIAYGYFVNENLFQQPDNPRDLLSDYLTDTHCQSKLSLPRIKREKFETKFLEIETTQKPHPFLLKFLILIVKSKLA